MKRPHSKLLVYGWALLLAVALVGVGVLGCTSSELRLGSGTTVYLNQLWGMVAEDTGSYADGAILVQFEMTLSPVGGMSVPQERTARVEKLRFVAWAHGPTIDVTATWPEKGLGELQTETDESRNDSMPLPVGYPLAELFSQLDYIGTSALFDGLRPYAGGEAIRLLLVYPPPQGPYGREWDVPLLVLRDHSLELISFGEVTAWRTDIRKWIGIPGVFQVLSASSEKLLAIVVVEGDWSLQG